ncbi:MAG: magnesium transporter, partial [Verrucomicrobiota bacterium]
MDKYQTKERMSAPNPKIIEANLGRAGTKWKWLRFFQRLGTLGGVVTFLIFLLGLAMQKGWLVSRVSALGFFVLIALGGLIGFFVIIVRVAGKFLPRSWLAEKIEEDAPTLLDRLNTLVFLEKMPQDFTLPSRWFQKRISQQTAVVLSENPPRFSFSARDALLHNLVFFALLAGTIYFFHHFAPWEQLRSSAQRRNAAGGRDPGDLALPDANAVEQKKEWGEVRITDPAQDLRVTKVDAVQLQIEAAASQQLTSNAWFSAVNGNEESPHFLSAPADPKYAIYQPVIYVDEFHLNDWDVMTYYAQSRAGDGQTYGSEVYFLEVRPFREDILKMPGGENGSAYQCLNQLTQLINRQQHVVRQTHHFLQTPADTSRVQEQDRGKLAEAEKDLGETTRHLYAEMTVKMENKPIGEVLDQLALAEKTLDRASGSLRQNEMTTAKNEEREALQQLIETRKIFQKTVSDHPDQFDEKKEETQETSPLADDSKDQLKEMAEFRNEGKATKEFVKEILGKQQALAAKAGTARATNFTELAQQERA